MNATITAIDDRHVYLRLHETLHTGPIHGGELILNRCHPWVSPLGEIEVGAVVNLPPRLRDAWGPTPADVHSLAASVCVLADEGEPCSPKLLAAINELEQAIATGEYEDYVARAAIVRTLVNLLYEEAAEEQAVHGVGDVVFGVKRALESLVGPVSVSYDAHEGLTPPREYTLRALGVGENT